MLRERRSRHPGRTVRQSRAVLAVAAVCAIALLAAGVCLAVGLAPVEPPSVLATATPGDTAPATPSTFDDSRKVQVSFVSGDPATVTSPVGGVLTRRSCTPGGSLDSGTVVAHVDERPLLGLNTSVPLYRDLQLGDRGGEVRALQDELTRLGRSVGSDGRLGPGTARAVAALLKEVGITRPDGSLVLPLDEIVRLPRVSTPVMKCADLGSTLEPGDELASAPAAVTAVRLSSIPRDLAPGARDLTVLGVTGAMTDGSSSTDPVFLATLAGAEGFTELVAAEDDAVPATLVLHDPIPVLQVPAAAVRTGDDPGTGCLALPGSTVPVDVVGSTLGASLVRLPEGTEPPTEVSLRVDDRRASCG